MSEQVILVNDNDQEIGAEEKMSAHREGKLHRAFSVLVFDKRGELLFPFAEYPVVPACQAGIGGQVATVMKATGEPSEALAKDGCEASGNEYKIEIPCALGTG